MLGRGFDGKIASGLPAPTVAESLRMGLITQGWCIACLAFADVCAHCEVHHLTTGGKHGQVRLGHAYTVGLCCWHHRGEIPLDLSLSMGTRRARALVAEVRGPSYAEEPSAFREAFGGDAGLLQLQARELRRVHDSFLISPGKYACPLN
jgi:hypothetical protein